MRVLSSSSSQTSAIIAFESAATLFRFVQVIERDRVYVNRYKGELVGWNRLIDELACQIEQRYAEHDQS